MVALRKSIGLLNTENEHNPPRDANKCVQWKK